MKDILFIFLGGGLGSLARYGVSRYFNPVIASFSLGTFLSNFLASFLLGIFLAIVQTKPSLSSIIPPLLLIGFCGGFSTFSTFSLDNYTLLKDEKILFFAINILVNVVLCLIGLWTGIKVGMKV